MFVWSGIVSTFAGSGGSGAEDGKASEASFKMPSGIAIDKEGSLYIADSWNCKIRKISLDGRCIIVIMGLILIFCEGVVTTIAGSGEQGWDDGPALQAS